LKQNTEELIAQKQEQINSFNTNIDTSNSTATTLQSEVAELQASIADQDKMRSKLDKLRDIARQIDSKLDKIQRETEFFSAHDDCPTCRQGIAHEHKTQIVEKGNTQISEIQAGKEKISEELETINNRLADISTTTSIITAKNREVSDILIQCRTWSGFVNDIEKEIDKLKNSNKQIETNNTELKTLKSDLLALITSKESLIVDKQVLDIANTLLKDSGIKTKIIKQYVPIMNKLINKYLASMEFFVNFELNESFEETIKSRFRDDFSYESFSEGEKSRIDLALLFTWRAVAKLRNSASTNLLILDEVFDSSMDVQGSDELMKILQTLATDTNIFVISHKTDQLIDKFNHLIRFEKHKNFSRMAS
jgi:DNA repair exonuclease SbcCD ATPase subunit